MPTEGRLEPGWNIYVIDSLHPAPAAGVSIGEMQFIILAHHTPADTATHGAILAHELGHSFGLVHYTGADPELNLMDEDISQTKETALGLTEAQIETARAQVATGEPLSTY